MMHPIFLLSPRVRVAAFALSLLASAACDDTARGATVNDDAGAAAPTVAVPADARANEPAAAPSVIVPPEAETSARVAAAAPAVRPTAARTPRRVMVGDIDLTGVGYDKGSPDAPVVIVNFSDFGCPFCGSFARETEPAIEREYIRTGKVFFKYVPFVMGMFPNGDQAARASECAAAQGKFWDMHDQLYARQAEWRRSARPQPIFAGLAAAIDLDAARFAQCVASPAPIASTERANAAARAVGIRATPTFIINGRGLEGALPLPQFRQVLDDMLAGRQ